MLHRSFKPAKCKTSLKLATSRLKLLKNKKEVQLKQMKRELAQLLEAGQDQTARIRVEHVVREEKTMAAYELLEIYCELIAARLPIIESQKNCPIDLKEAITSVVFASPRCADVPELKDVHKQFTTKYGKEFISAAVELRPDCGVSRMLVEKLSAKAPDGPTKIKILSAIAEEHNIKWEPKSFGEKELKPPEDLLNGPSTFEKASRMQTEHPIVQPPSFNVQVPPSPDRNHNASMNFEHNTRPSTSFANVCSDGGEQATMPAPYHPVESPSETRSENMEVRHSSYSGDGNSFSSDRKHWNMEFKDATAAAQAAAESAERASMAARAAAELSIQANISRQHSTESLKSNTNNSRDERPAKNVSSKLQVEQFAKVSGYNFVQDRNPQIQTERVDGSEHDNPDESAEKFYRDDHGSTKRSSRSGALRTNRASIDDDQFMNDLQKADRYSQKNSFGGEAVKAEKSSGSSGMSMKKQSIGSEAEFASSLQGGVQSDDFNYFGAERIGKQSSSVSSHSHSSNHGDDYDVSLTSHQKFSVDGNENPFFGIEQGNVRRDTVHTSSYNDTAVVFDESVSDDEIISFDAPKYDRQESKLYSISPDRGSHSRLSSHADTWSPRNNRSGSLENFASVSRVSAEWHSPPKFDESSTKSAHPSQPDEFLPVAFDESEGPSSESEDELDKSRFGVKTDTTSLPHKESNFFRSPDHSQRESHGFTGSFVTAKGYSGSNRKQDLDYSSDDDELGEVSADNNRVTESSAPSQRKFGFDEVPTRQLSSKLAKSQMTSNAVASEPFYNQEEERKSSRSQQTSRLSVVNEVKAANNTYNPDSSETMKDDELFQQSSLESGKEFKFETLTGGLRNKGYRLPPYIKSPSGDASSSTKAAEDSVTADEHIPAVKSTSKSGVRTEMENKSSSRIPITDPDSDSDDSEEELPQRHSRIKRGSYGQKASKEVDTKSRLRVPVTFFDSDYIDPEEDVPKQTFTSKGRVGSAFSRRTKATPSSGTGSYSKTSVGSEVSANSDADAKNIPSRSSYRSETPPDPRSQTANSGNWESPAEPRAKQSTSKPLPESNISTRKEDPKSSAIEQPSGRQENLKSSAKQATSKPMPESNISTRKENPRSSAFEPPSTPLKTVASATTSSPTASTSSGGAPSRESSIGRASHIHPKLPDYDTIAAQLQSLRSNR